VYRSHDTIHGKAEKTIEKVAKFMLMRMILILLVFSVRARAQRSRSSNDGVEHEIVI